MPCTFKLNGFRFYWVIISALIFFGFSNQFVRPYDDFKELILYASLTIYCLVETLHAFARKENRSPTVLSACGFLFFPLYGLFNIVVMRSPWNEGVPAVGAYFLIGYGAFWLSRKDVSDLKFVISCLVFFSSGIFLISSLVDSPVYGIIPPIGHVSYFSDTMTVLIPWAFYFAYTTTSHFYKFASWLALIPLTCMVFMSGRRAPFIEILLALGIFLAAISTVFKAHQKKIRRVLLIVFTILATATSLYVAIQKASYLHDGTTWGRFEDLWNSAHRGDAWNTNPRAIFLQRSSEAVRARPLLGWGYGNFRFVYPRFVESTDPEPPIFLDKGVHWLMHPHNEIAFQLFEGGFVGTLLLAGMAVLIWRGLWAGMKRIEDQNSLLNLILLTEGGIFFGIGLFNVSLLMPVLRLLLMFHLGLALRLIRSSNLNIPLLHPPPRTALALGFSLLLTLSPNTIAYHACHFFISQTVKNPDGKSSHIGRFLAPHAYETLMRSGIGYFAAGDFLKAKSDFARMVATFPNVPQGYYQLGLVCMKLRQNDQAKRVLEEGLRRFPFYQGVQHLHKNLVTNQ
jgi:hypothetical protein